MMTKTYITLIFFDFSHITVNCSHQKNYPLLSITALSCCRICTI